MIASIYDAFLSCNQQITTDSRNICKNDIFFALKGPNFDGNLYANKALTLGASFAVIDEKKYFIEGKTFLVDDVLSSGTTLIYGIKHFLEVPLKKFKTAVLVNRNHKKYPVKADFKGISLSTSVKEHIQVEFSNNRAIAYLV